MAKQNGLIGGDGLTANMGYALLNKKLYENEYVSFDDDVISLITATITSSGESVVLPTILNDTQYTAKSHALIKFDLSMGKWKVLYWVDEEVGPNETSQELYINFIGRTIIYIGRFTDNSISFNHSIEIQTAEFYEGSYSDSFGLNHSIGAEQIFYPSYTVQIEDSFKLSHNIQIQATEFYEGNYSDSFKLSDSIEAEQIFYPSYTVQIEDGFGLNHTININYGEFKVYDNQALDSSFGLAHTSSETWEAEVTATFDSAGGSPTYSSVSGQIPLSVSNPGTPTKSGYTFNGWSPSLPRTITENTTFTAQWSLEPDGTEWIQNQNLISFDYTLNIEVANAGACVTSATTAKQDLEAQYPATEEMIGTRARVRYYYGEGFDLTFCAGDFRFEVI